MSRGVFRITFTLHRFRTIDTLEFGDPVDADGGPSERSNYGLTVRETPASLKLIGRTVTIPPTWYDQPITTACMALADVLKAKFHGSDLRAIDEAWYGYLPTCTRPPHIALVAAFLGEPGETYGRELRLRDPVPVPPDACCQHCGAAVPNGDASREPQARMPLLAFNNKGVLPGKTDWRPVLVCTHACLRELQQKNKELVECQKTLKKMISTRIPIPEIRATARSPRKG